MSSPIDRWFSVLELPTDAPRAAVDQAHRELVQVWHPDRFVHNRALQLKAEAKLKDINEAYDGLTNAWSTIRDDHEVPSSSHVHRPDGKTSGITAVCSGCQRRIRVSVVSRTPIRARCPYCGTICQISIPPGDKQELSSDDSADLTVPAAFSKTATRIGWIFVAGVAVLLLATFPKDDDPYRVVSFTPLPTASSTALTQPPPADVRPCEAEPATRPASGAELARAFRGGRGRITISNGTDNDAVAVLHDETTGDPRRAIYIRDGEVGLVTSIPAGSYRLRFQFGDRWLASRQFCTLSGTSEFAEAFEFTENVTAGGTTYATYSVTLHKTAEGNAQTTRLPNVALVLPPE